MSVSVGGPGATVNFSKKGAMLTVGVPGTGLSFRQHVGQRPDLPTSESASQNHFPSEAPSHYFTPVDTFADEIKSAEIATLSSPDLIGLKTLILEAMRQKSGLNVEFKKSCEIRLNRWKKFRRSEQFPLRFLMPGLQIKRKLAFESADHEALQIAQALALTRLNLEFNLNEKAILAFKELESAHGHLARAQRIWDVTALKHIDRKRERSAASKAINRAVIKLSNENRTVINTNMTSLVFGNANGGDICILPGIVLLRSNSKDDFALIDIQALKVDAQRTKFIEEGAVFSDSKIVDQAWAKSNADGSKDRRFRSNYQMPVVEYGEIHFSSSTGMNEVYQSSHCNAALDFSSAFSNFQNALKGQSESADIISTTSLLNNNIDELEIIKMLPNLPEVGHSIVITTLIIIFIFLIACNYLVNFKYIYDIISLSKNSETQSVATIDQKNLIPPNPSLDLKLVPEYKIIQQHIIIKETANIRSGPSTTSHIIRSVLKGTSFTVFQKSGSWIQVGDEAPIGWVFSELTQPLN